MRTSPIRKTMLIKPLSRSAIPACCDASKKHICQCQVHAAIAPMQSLLHYNKQRNTDVEVCQANEQFDIDISRNSVQCGLSSHMEPCTTILTRNYRQPEWSRGIWKSHRDNRTSSACVSVLRRHKEIKLIFWSVNWNHLQALQVCRRIYVSLICCM